MEIDYSRLGERMDGGGVEGRVAKVYPGFLT